MSLDLKSTILIMLPAFGMGFGMDSTLSAYLSSDVSELKADIEYIKEAADYTADTIDQCVYGRGNG